MVAIKHHQAERFVARPDPAVSILLIYGTDPGLVGERAATAASAMAKRDNPPGEIIRILDGDLDEDRGRLAVEFGMMPMFGGRKVIRTAISQRINANLLKPLIETPEPAATLIIEAGNLKPTDTLRKLCEKSAHTAAVACFPDEQRDLEAVVQSAIRSSGLQITPYAEELLISRLGADRALSRGEIEKLTLYCQGKQRIEAEDVEQIVGDASQQALDRIVDAAASADAATATRELYRAAAAGENTQGVILAIQRHFMRLHKISQQMENGRSLPEALKSLRPPLHFKQRDAFTKQLRIWRSGNSTLALTAIAATALQARRQSPIEDTLTQRLFMRLAQLARS
ncbi:MAG: DNA polymerase III subunit delta [Pseudomonadota bacterium]